MIYNHITIKKRRVLKKIGKFSLLTVLALTLMLSNSVARLSAFEAHVVNVTATIENRPFVLINKVYYDVLSPDRGIEPANEWVEIYNNTEIPMDISGWKICDNISCDTIPNKPPLLVGGFAIITGSSTTSNFWHIPTSTPMIVLADGKIGNGLHNNADMLFLKNTDDIIVDQMNWGAPDSNWVNYNSNIWDPGALDVNEGHALCRKPTGYDTNVSSDFQDCGLPPVVDLIYPAGGEGWGTNQRVTIRWSATNPNGSDNDLMIDIFFITDNDYSRTITSRDRVYHIANKIANTGSFRWNVNPGFWGAIWIKLVATGPDNFMQNDFETSGPVWEPPLPDEPTDLVPPQYSPEEMAELIEMFNLSPADAGLLEQEQSATTTNVTDDTYEMPSIEMPSIEVATTDVSEPSNIATTSVDIEEQQIPADNPPDLIVPSVISTSTDALPLLDSATNPENLPEDSLATSSEDIAAPTSAPEDQAVPAVVEESEQPAVVNSILENNDDKRENESVKDESNNQNTNENQTGNSSSGDNDISSISDDGGTINNNSDNSENSGLEEFSPEIAEAI